MSALFTFADGPEAKYLSQFIPSAVTFVNHIPAELLSKYNTRHDSSCLEYGTDNVISRSHWSHRISCST